MLLLLCLLTSKILAFEGEDTTTTDPATYVRAPGDCWRLALLSSGVLWICG